MCEDKSYDNIRPYYDSEVRAAIDRLADSEGFFEFMNPLWKELDRSMYVELTKDCKTREDFRINFLIPFFTVVTDTTTSGLSIEGLDYLEQDKTYLFISDHRDIILDSSILNIFLTSKGLMPTENAIGSNLLLTDWIIDLVKLNACFTVDRDIPIREFKEASVLRSNYIRSRITENKSSIWIAQREGRTKDGDDRTQHSLLKMINLSGGQDFVKNFKELCIVPVSISYEYEPCDVFKTSELYQKQMFDKYDKAPGEDLNSMIYGMVSNKERVHMSLCKPLTIVLDDLANIGNTPEQYKALADIIDYRIHSSYKHWPDNYIAYDLLKSTVKYTDQYTEEEKEAFINNMKLKMSRLKGEEMILNKIYLEMYANPVINYLNMEKPKFF
jgi:hypothetical protein